MHNIIIINAKLTCFSSDVGVSSIDLLIGVVLIDSYKSIFDRTECFISISIVFSDENLNFTNS